MVGPNIGAIEGGGGDIRKAQSMLSYVLRRISPSYKIPTYILGSSDKPHNHNFSGARLGGFPPIGRFLHWYLPDNFILLWAGSQINFFTET